MKLVLFLLAITASAEVHHLSLRQAIELALKQNPDLALARLDERKAQEDVRVARDPFTPRIAVGSGLAFNNGFPMSIEGSAPSVIQARANQYLFNRQQTWTVAKVRENARGAGIAAASKHDEVVYRVASLLLDAERAARALELARKQVDSLEKVAQTVRARVEEGRALELENKQAAYQVARGRQRVEILESDLVAAESALAFALGFEENDLVRPVEETRLAQELSVTEEAAVERALRASKELRKLESDLLAEGLDIKAQKAAKLPRIDLVAQYGLFARYNNYDDYFRTFQRHNGLLGISFQVPLLVGPSVAALSAQAEVNAAKLRVQRNAARQRISLDTRKSYREIQQAQTASQVARLDLDVAREQLSVALALIGEGRATLRQVEEARFTENEKWLAFYDAQYGVERARLNLLKQTGELALLR
ncbi:MAG: TolC family protein [Candidatus Solibacter usitatus]|nr:TolC family protein [Candidatus Solibacter usitatus]